LAEFRSDSRSSPKDDLPAGSSAGGRAALGNLQVQSYALAVDEDGSCIYQLLAGAIVLFVTPQGSKWEEKFNRLSSAGRG